jgi:hypothetical protein
VMRTVLVERLMGTICGILVNCALKKSMMAVVRTSDVLSLTTRRAVEFEVFTAKDKKALC